MVRIGYPYLIAIVAAISGCGTPAPNRAPPAPERVSSSSASPVWKKMGYHPVVKNGQTVYCRTEMVTNSHFTSTTCLTEDQIKERSLKQQRMQDDLLRGQDLVNCQSVKCSN
jgi:hypothetical protein